MKFSKLFDHHGKTKETGKKYFQKVKRAERPRTSVRKNFFSKRILLCTLMTAYFIEFQTNECVSNHKETINRSIQNRVELLLFPRRFEVLLHRP